MARSSWKGHIRLSLVTIPVKAYTASASSKEIRLNQLHDQCKSRVKYQKVCPQHGQLAAADIVKGYEFAKDQYVIIDESELDDLRTDSDRAITIDTFVPPDQVDSVYFSGRSYYLAPDGPIGHKPYNLLLQAMLDDDLCSVAQVVMHGREQLVLLRPAGRLICMQILSFHEQLKNPADFEGEVEQTDLDAAELQLTKQLIAATRREELDLAQYENTYHEKLSELIEAKVAGKEIVAAADEQPEQVINLMDALRASVAQAEDSAAVEQPPEKKPRRRVAKSATSRKKGAKKTG